MLSQPRLLEAGMGTGFGKSTTVVDEVSLQSLVTANRRKNTQLAESYELSVLLTKLQAACDALEKKMKQLPDVKAAASRRDSSSHKGLAKLWFEMHAYTDSNRDCINSYMLFVKIHASVHSYDVVSAFIAVLDTFTNLLDQITRTYAILAQPSATASEVKDHGESLAWLQDVYWPDSCDTLWDPVQAALMNVCSEWLSVATVGLQNTAKLRRQFYLAVQPPDVEAVLRAIDVECVKNTRWINLLRCQTESTWSRSSSEADQFLPTITAHLESCSYAKQQTKLVIISLQNFLRQYSPQAAELTEETQNELHQHTVVQ